MPKHIANKSNCHPKTSPYHNYVLPDQAFFQLLENNIPLLIFVPVLLKRVMDHFALEINHTLSHTSRFMYALFFISKSIRAVMKMSPKLSTVYILQMFPPKQFYCTSARNITTRYVVMKSHLYLHSNSMYNA